VIAEGLHLAETRVPDSLAGMTLAEAAIPTKAGCNVVALRSEIGLRINPDPSTVLTSGSEMILIGTPESEERFMKLYGAEALSARPIAPSQRTVRDRKSNTSPRPGPPRNPIENRRSR
jgi:uncharacterized protein with PhoU and TrkA domain